MSTQEIPSTDDVQDISMDKTKDIEPKPEQKDMDIDTDINEQEMIANAMSGDKIKELLAAEGPTVKAVLLKTDGSVEEILYDSTPSKNHVSTILGAPPSIIGQYPDLDVIVVGPRYDESETDQFQENKHKLRYPFNNDTFRGDIFLYRFNQQCVTVDFTAKEYQEFASKAHEDDGKVFQPEQFEEEEEEEYDEEAMQEMMRNVIINKVKKEYPLKFGREPTEQELEDMVNATLGLFAGAPLDDEYEDDDYDEEEDEEYDPEDDQQQAINDEVEDIPNDEELENDKKDIEHTMTENEAPLQEVLDEEEEKIVNSAEFENELRSAIEIVQNVAKIDKLKMMEMVKQSYKNDFGEDMPQEMMQQAMHLFAMQQSDEMQDAVEVEEKEEDEEEEEEAVDPELFAKEMEEALDNVRKLGAMHQQEFVDRIKGTYAELNGVEPTKEQIVGILDRIKAGLAEEARDEFLEAQGVGDDDEDEEDAEDVEYKPDEQDMQQIEDDKKMEVLEELMQEKLNMDVEDAGNEKVGDKKVEAKKVKVLVTPIKRRPSGSRVDIYLDEQRESTKKLEVGVKRFEQINGRAPDENDKQRLKDFMETGMLFDAEIDADLPFDDEDEEEDEEYDPAKDEFDYSKDIEDDLEFEKEHGMKENEDTSNMIDID